MNATEYNWKSTGPGGCDSHCIEHPCGVCITGMREHQYKKQLNGKEFSTVIYDEMIENSGRKRYDVREDKFLPPEYLGVTSITTACESLKHYHWAKVLKRREETPALLEGIQFHMLILEPEKFYAAYFTDLDLPEGKRVLKTVDELKSFAEEMELPYVKGKKEDWIRSLRPLMSIYKDVLIYDDWFEANTAGKEYISKAKWTMLHEMKQSVLTHSFAKKYLDISTKEVFIEGEFEGQKIRGRLDWLVDDPALPCVIVLDLKKCKSAKYGPFMNEIRFKHYFVQAALYVHMLEQKYNKPVIFAWMAVEGVWPYVCESWNADNATLEAGLSFARKTIKKIKEGYETNVWPGYTNGLLNPIAVPKEVFDSAAAFDLEDDHNDAL